MKKGFSLGLMVGMFYSITFLSLKPVQADVCLPGVGCLGGEGVFDVTLGSFNIYLKNRSGRPINACVEYYSKTNFSTTDGSGTNWTSGCWNLSPGREVFVINDAMGRNAYFSADATDGSGVRWDRKEVDMGGTYTKFVFAFN
jgi:hypothetical protein